MRFQKLKNEFNSRKDLGKDSYFPNLCASQFQDRPSPPPPPRANPGHLTRVKLCTVGNLTQNEARPVGHLTFVSKRLSAVGNKRISQFFGPFALTSHMVQNPPYWMAKECSRFEHKGIPNCQARLSFVFDVPVEDVTFFCHPVWRILYHVTS